MDDRDEDSRRQRGDSADTRKENTPPAFDGVTRTSQRRRADSDAPAEDGDATASEIGLTAMAAPAEVADTIASDPGGAAPGAGPKPGAVALQQGSRLDRFVIEGELGKGGMGVVFSAYDPDLDRKVAIKLLRPRRLDDEVVARPQEWLLREAQAMARLAHPNVVVVHEVGTFDEQIFVAMEFVDGSTLKKWLREEKRSWREIVDVFVHAGRGLAAAHEAGLVHRDFKPDNVLLGKDGRVRVTDFGLVGVTAAVASDGVERAQESAGAGSARPLDLTFAKTGSVFGTPSYMAPEQHQGRAVDARADQFAFCVALYEALFGQRPFNGASYRELADRACTGEIDPVEGDAAVPAWVRRVVLRGLRPEASERFPSMDALLTELGTDPTAARKRRLRLAGLAAGFAIMSGLATYGLVRSTRGAPSRCQGAGERLGELWDGDRKRAVEQAFLATKRPYAPDTYARVESALDDYAARWAALRASACEATHVRGEQSHALFDLRMRCLDQRLGEMGALVDVFAGTSDAGVLDEAVHAVVGLGDLAACSDVEALTAAVPPPSDPEASAEVLWLQAQVDRAAALQRAGRYKEALAAARGAAEAARKTDHGPLRARALHRLGAIEARAGSAGDAERALREAVQVAAGARDDVIGADCWIELVGVIGQRGDRHDEARALGATASAAVARAGERPLQRAALLAELGALDMGRGKYADGRDHYAKALELTGEALGPDHPEVATAQSALGDALTTLGDYDAARDHLERALAITEETLGSAHPGVARALAALANAYGNQGKFAEAETHYRRALAIRGRAFGTSHPRVAKNLYSLGVAVGEQNRLDDALAFFLRALEIQKRTLGHGHPETAWTVNSIGVIQQRQGRLGVARATFREALALFENRLGKDHPNVGYPLNNLGEIAVLEGQFERALAYCERAHSVGEKALGAEHPALAHELTCIGNALTGLRRPTEAILRLESALSRREANPGNPEEIAETRFALARALWDARRDRKRARALAAKALAGFTAAGEIAAAERGVAAAWLAERSPRGGEKPR